MKGIEKYLKDYFHVEVGKLQPVEYDAFIIKHGRKLSPHPAGSYLYSLIFHAALLIFVAAFAVSASNGRSSLSRSVICFYESNNLEHEARFAADDVNRFLLNIRKYYRQEDFR